MKQLKKSDVDIIIEHLNDETESVLLSDKQREKLDRWDFADNLIRRYRNPDKVAVVLMKKFGISRATAHRDISSAKQAFKSISKSEKEYWRRVAIGWVMDTIHEAWKQKDLKAKNAAEANFIKLLAFDKEDPDMPLFTELEPHTYNINIAPELKTRIIELISMGAVNLSALAEKEKTIDVTHTDLKDGDQPQQ